MCCADNFSVEYDDSTDRDFPHLKSKAGFFQSQPHKINILFAYKHLFT